MGNPISPYYWKGTNTSPLVKVSDNYNIWEELGGTHNDWYDYIPRHTNSPYNIQYGRSNNGEYFVTAVHPKYGRIFFRYNNPSQDVIDFIQKNEDAYKKELEGKDLNGYTDQNGYMSVEPIIIGKGKPTYDTSVIIKTNAADANREGTDEALKAQYEKRKLPQVEDPSKLFADMMTLGTASQMEHGADQIRQGDYVKGGFNMVAPLLFAKGPVGNVLRLLYGGYHLANDEGIPKTVREFSNGNYGRGAVSLVGDVVNGVLAGSGLYGTANNIRNYAAQLGNQTAKASIIAQELNNSIRGTKYLDWSTTGPSVRKLEEQLGLLQDIENRPGWQLKELIKGNPLESKVNRFGEIHKVVIQKYINNNIKDPTTKQLMLQALEKFDGERINYNDFLKTVQEGIHTQQPLKTIDILKNYGLSELKVLDRSQPGLGYGEPIEYKGDWRLFRRDVEGIKDSGTNLFSDYIENRGVTQINRLQKKHFKKDAPSSHFRWFISEKEPDILHVPEYQSDLYEGLKIKQLPSDFPKESITSLKHNQANFHRQLLIESLKFAKEKGIKQVRYPTKETAIKIQYYPEKTFNYRLAPKEAQNEFNHVVSVREALDDMLMNGKIDSDLHGRILKNQILPRFKNISDKYGRTPEQEYKTILERYDNFEKTVKGLIPNAKIETVTDLKGNSWYQLTVPENLEQLQFAYKIGGKINARYK